MRFSEKHDNQRKLDIEFSSFLTSNRNAEMSFVSDPSAGGYDPYLDTSLVTSRHADLSIAPILIPQNAIFTEHRVKWASLICGGCGDVVHFKQSCADKFCSPCFARRAKRVHRDASDMLRLMLTPKLITLTYGRQLLTLQLLNNIRHDLHRLLHRKRFKLAIDGGFYWIELGEVREDLTCNIHIHMMVGSDYIPYQQLSDAWNEITGFPMVSIQKINDARQGAFYLNKYCAKPVKGEEALSYELRLYINQVLKNVRMIQTFGDAGLPHLPSRCKLCGAQGLFISITYELDSSVRDLLERNERCDWVRLPDARLAGALERWVDT